MSYEDPIYTLAQVSDVITLGFDVEVAVGALSVLSGKIVIVRGEGELPHGVLTHEMAFRWVGEDRSLSDYRNQLAPVAMVTHDTSIGSVIKSVFVDRYLPWFIVTENAETFGVVSPHALLRQWMPELRELISQGAPLDRFTFNSIVNPIVTNPSHVPKCYCCPDMLNAKQPHQLNPNTLYLRNVYGQFFCPNHPNTLVVVKVNCLSC